MTTKSVRSKKCPVCKWGLGLWAIGDPSPMRPMDAKDGYQTIKCPKCGGNKNPMEKYD